jgi:diadenosine tetraphosphatase ApaH/serine/threonine PP2A family protein phosphatase
MLYLVIGDIHGNLEAFKSVLEDARKRGSFEKVICLGDIVGYGPEPHECIETLKSLDNICVAGNHDWAATGKISIEGFNSNAIDACRWTRRQLTEDDNRFLNDLPELRVFSEFTIAHGSPREPISEYLFSPIAAEDNFALFDTMFCLVGHTHVPMIFENSSEGILQHEFGHEDIFPAGSNRLIINPGGVGQPRDQDPRAAYALYDDEKNAIFGYRVEYDIATTQKKMSDAGLPEFLVSRLNYGW